MESQTLSLSDYQTNVLIVPEQYDLFLGGGRGGGKSIAAVALITRHVEQYGPKASVLYLRKTHQSLQDMEMALRDFNGKLFGSSASYNQALHVWKYANGSQLELGELADHTSLIKYQGRSFSLIIVDECGQFADPTLIDLVRANLRSNTVPVRMVLIANPGGVGHGWIYQRYIVKAEPWVPIVEATSKRTFVYAPSTHRDNPFINQDEYQDQLIAATAGDPELGKAWIHGEWAIARGAYFASVLDQKRNLIEPWAMLPRSFKGLGYRMRGTVGWSYFWSHDFGVSAPSVSLLMGISPGEEVEGRWYPRGSYVVLDEIATNKPNRWNEGLGWTVPIIAEEIVKVSKRYGVKPIGYADDAIFAKTGSANGSIAEEFRRAGVYFEPARKLDRISGWQALRRLMADAGKPDVPGMYISRNAEYLWATLPFLGRDPKRIEDVNSSEADHGADALRYAIIADRMKPRRIEIVGV